MKVTSASVGKDGRLNVDCTCDGQCESPAISWSNVPKGTKSFAISLWHTARDQEKSYWVVYDIPASARGLNQNQKAPGTIGINGKNRMEYDPMCSQGPGAKTYHITVFALSRELQLKPRETSRTKLLEAVRDCTLAETTLDFVYERSDEE